MRVCPDPRRQMGSGGLTAAHRKGTGSPRHPQETLCGRGRGEPAGRQRWRVPGAVGVVLGWSP